jgi:hypothetical protein
MGRGGGGGGGGDPKWPKHLKIWSGTVLQYNLFVTDIVGQFQFQTCAQKQDSLRILIQLL